MTTAPSAIGTLETQAILTKARQVESTGNFAYAETLCFNILRTQPAEHAARLLLRKSQNSRYQQKHGSLKPAAKIGSTITFFSAKTGPDPLRDAELAETALKDNPCDIPGNQLLQSAAKRLGWVEIEQLCLDQIAEGTPTAENIVAKAAGLRTQRQFSRAIAILEKAQLLYPTHQGLQKALRDIQADGASAAGWEDARTFTDVVKPASAEDEAQTLSERIRNEPENLALVDQLVLVLERAGKETEVLEWIAYRRSIEDNPALRRKAWEIRRRQGSFTPEEEREELEQFVKQQPSDLELRLALGSLLLRQGDAPGAILHLQRARKNAKITSRVESILALAEAYDQVSLPSLGEKSRSQALEFAREDEALQKEILYRMARSLESLGKAEEAKARWLELFEIDAEFKDTAQRVLGERAKS